MAELVYPVAVSQDGYIAGPGDAIDDFVIEPELIDHLVRHYPETLPTHVRAHLGVQAQPQRFGSVLMGRSTYEIGAKQGVGSPYQDLDQYVVSRSLTSLPSPGPRLVSEDPVATVRRLKAGEQHDIWLCGGGALAGALIDEIDTLVIKRQPVLFGGGTPMVSGRYSPTRFDLVEERHVGSVVISEFRRSAVPTC